MIIATTTINLSSLDGTHGFRLDGETVSDKSGFSVSNAGDVNGDGFDDVIIGAPLTDPNGSESGASYVVFGQVSGFNPALDLSSLNGNTGFRMDGATAYDRSGRSVSGAGDVNGDGFDDLIVGARLSDQNGYDYSYRNGSGASYVVFGKASGFSATLNLSDLDGSNGYRLDGQSLYSAAGHSVSSAGDVNGDGYDDLIVGARDPFAMLPEDEHQKSGASYVIFGKASGFSAALDLSNLDSNSGFRLNGEIGDFSGWSVSGAGDMNSDGFDDLLIGAPGADANGESSGSSYVVFGRSDFGNGNVIEGTPGDDTLQGTPEADSFEAGYGNDTMLGRGGADVFNAGAGNDDIKISDLSFALVDGGTGDDVLHLAGSDLNLDVVSSDGKISGIETICLYGTGDNTLTLTAADVFNLSDTTNTLEVNGDAGDHILGLNSGWTDGGIGPNGYFYTYTQGDAVLLVGMNLTTDFV